MKPSKTHQLYTPHTDQRDHSSRPGKVKAIAIREDRCEFYGVQVNFTWWEGRAVIASFMYNEMVASCTLSGPRAHILALLIVAWVEDHGCTVKSFTLQQDHFELPSARVVVSMMIEPDI